MSKTKSKKNRKSKNEECCGTEFCCFAPDAEAVFLTGGFNDWSTDGIPMEKDFDGQWHGDVELPSGRHELKFIVDGQWHCESNCIPNELGTMNQIVDV